MRTRLMLVGLTCLGGWCMGCASPQNTGLQPNPATLAAPSATTNAALPSPEYEKLLREFSGQPAEPSMLDKATAPARSLGRTLKGATAAVADKLTPQPRVIPASDPVSLASQPEHIGVEVYYSAARLAESGGNFSEAIRQYQRGLEADPEHVPTLISLARLHDRRDQFAEAVACYRQAIQAAPDNAMAHNDLGLCLARQGQNGEAVAELTTATRLEPTRKLYHNNRATVLVQMGRLDDAWQDLSTAHAPAVAHYNFGYLLSRINRKPEALQQFALACQADPSLQPAADMYRQLAAELQQQPALIARAPGQPAQPQAPPAPRRVPPVEPPPQTSPPPSNPGVRLQAPRPLPPGTTSSRRLKPPAAEHEESELLLPIQLVANQIVEAADAQAALPTPDELGL